MRTYEVASVEHQPPLVGAVEGTPWEEANLARLDQFAWYEGGPKPATEARALADGDALYLQFQVEDREISAEPRELNGPVYEDSCVEFFARPRPEREGWYLNFEANCVGDFHLGWREPRGPSGEAEYRLISEEMAADIDVRTSVPGPRKDPQPDDESWWLAVELPVATLRAFTGEAVSVAPGTEWSGNFYRHGVPAGQRSTWNRIETPRPNYHTPEYFGRLRFV